MLAAFEALATPRDLPLKRDKTRVTRVIDGFDFIGFHVVKRKSPKSGKHTIDTFPAHSAQQKIRNRLKSRPSRRAPIPPQEVVERVNPIVTGWATYCRPTNASQAVRGLQRFVNLCFCRYLPHRSTGRGFGWKRFPNSKLYAMGLVYIGSGMRTYRTKPAHDVRGRLSDRRTREN